MTAPLVTVTRWGDKTTIVVTEPLEPGHIYEFDNDTVNIASREELVRPWEASQPTNI